MPTLLRLLHLRPGETRRVLWVAVMGISYATATSLGDDIAQSVFVTRVGAQSMPLVFLCKGLLDIIAAGLYLPLARGRSPGKVWRVALGIYIVTVIAARMAVVDGSDLSAYLLFIGHECAWTILTIHWGVFILAAFDASQARRLFPLLFTAARLGGIIAGLALRSLAGPIGVANLLFAAAAAAAIAGALSLLGRTNPTAHTPPATSARFAVVSPDRAAADEDIDDDDAAGDSGLWASWRQAAASPLVRIIAWSTAAMVLVRYGLHMVAIDEISNGFANDGEMVAEFLGMFGAIANAAGIILGVFIVPRILTRLGVGFANLAYAGATVVSFATLFFYPSLATAALARFTRVQLKDSLKTPLSTLFYGAEPPHRRAPARAFVFGVAIPLATIVTAATLELSRNAEDMILVSAIGVAASLFFVGVCAVQNRRWRRRIAELLTWKLARAPAPTARRLAASEALLADYSASADAALIASISRGLASDDTRLRAVAEEVLAETIPRKRAHEIVAESHATGR